MKISGAVPQWAHLLFSILNYYATTEQHYFHTTTTSTATGLLEYTTSTTPGSWAV